MGKPFAPVVVAAAVLSCWGCAPSDDDANHSATPDAAVSDAGGSGAPDAGTAMDAGACPIPALPCLPGCNPCTGTCQRGQFNTTTCTCEATTVPDVLAVAVTPASLALVVGDTANLVATVTHGDCSTSDGTATSTWQSDAPSIAHFTGMGALQALAEGTARVTASVGTVLSLPVTVTVGPAAEHRELRGVWVTRFAYNTRTQLEGIIDRAAAAGFNAVFVQIRGTGDAYYASTREPWARQLTGTLGRNPGWDPLQVALDRAHAHQMQLHAYFNALSAWPAGAAPPAAEGTVQHALYAHPEWLAVNSNGVNADTEYQWFTPGNPAVRAHLAAVAEDLLTRYPVDGLHLDRIRVAGRDYSHDAVAQAAYDSAHAADSTLTWDAFMRAQVNQVVADIHAALQRARPAAVLSASVWGIHTPLSGCSTSAGYRDYHQDSLAWMSAGTMDALVPMMYWPINPGGCTDWAALLDGFMSGRAGRHIWAGMHALEGASAFDFAAIRARIDRSRLVAAHGTVVFASSYLDQGTGRWEAFVGTGGSPGPYAAAAVVPSMSWKP